MYRFPFLWFACLLPTVVSAGEMMVDSGKSEYRIVVDASAIPAEQTAARELQSFLEKSTGVKLPIEKEKDGPAIFVGQSPSALKTLGLKSWAELKPDEIRMKTVGKDLFLVGDRPRGTLYSVYEFLEQQLGIRFWTADVTDIPRHPQLTLPQLNDCYVPPFQVRSAGYHTFLPHLEFAVKMRNNMLVGHGHKIPAEWGGDVQVLGGVHTFSGTLIPVKTYFAAHPEWFAERDGRRQGNDSQLCLTNQELRRELTRRVLEQLAQHPGCRYISVSQNDNCNFCQCPACTAFIKKHGNQTDLLIDAINEVAVAVKQKYPAVLVETLAYQDTRKPPQSIRPLDNIIIRYCTIEQQSFQPLTDRHNQNIYRDLMGWKQQARPLMIWNYVTNFRKYYQPHPNWSVLAPDLRLFRDCGAINVYEQGSWNGGDGIADLSDLRAWLTSKLLWNPGCDPKLLIREFLIGYYGPAANAVGSYIDLMNRSAFQHPAAHDDCFSRSTTDWLDAATLLQAFNIMSEAKRQFGSDPVYGHRVTTAAIPITIAFLERQPIGNLSSAPESSSVNYDKLVAETLADIKKAGVLRMNERGLSPETWAKRLLFFHAPNDSHSWPVLAGKKYHAWPIPGLADLNGLNKGIADKGLFIDKDSAAASGTAIRMPNTHTQWYAQVYELPAGIFDLYIEARADSSQPQGNAIRIGTYDFTGKKEIAKDFPAREIAGNAYHLIKFGRVTLKDNMCVFVAPVKNPAVKNIWIDRLVLVRPE